MKITPQQIWEINRIMVVIEADPKEPEGFMLYTPPKHLNRSVDGICAHGDFEMTIEQAKQLVKDLQKQINIYEELEASAQEVCAVPTEFEPWDDDDND